ncbi:hypothetical protein TRIUR3_05637 [Triticum urartu]|uniref:Uncharacterized protein n=1 Tax=Triticum urartu TaxID=4572 RepID=M7Z7K7_TRIUA|nr:hypothetical protein TRIUR3_05637 [Triticum urartu]
MAGTTVLAFVEQGGGTTARRQRYNRSVKVGEHQGPAVQPLQGALESALALATDRLSRAEDDKETLLKEKATLSNTVNKLNRDVAKFSAFLANVKELNAHKQTREGLLAITEPVHTMYLSR